MRDEEKSRDIVQDSFMKMWEKVGEINYSKGKSYLFTTAYHTMIDFIRKDKKQTTYDDITPYDTEGVNDNYSDVKEILDEAVKKLPETQRSVLLLRDYEGYSYKEIGDMVGLNESQVKVYIYRARVFLKNYIGSLDAVI
jgi:RNA polymerase sigma factor (sigma-70 family)